MGLVLIALLFNECVGSRRHAVGPSSDSEEGRVPLPGGFQKPELVLSLSEDEVLALAGSTTLADQKLVSLMVFPSGRSRMKRPNPSRVQKPLNTASDVQTYVFCG